MSWRKSVALVSVSFLAACGSSGGGTANDSGARDAEVRDAEAARDVGPDAGRSDAGPSDIGPADSGTADTGESDSGLDGGVAGVEHRGVLLSLEDEVTPLEAVEVCAGEGAARVCAMTDAAGAYTLAGLPERAEVVLSFSRNDLIPVIRPYDTGEQAPGDPPLVSYSTTYDHFLVLVMDAHVTPDFTKGALTFVAERTEAGGARARSAGVSAAIEPPGTYTAFFQDAEGHATTMLTETSTRGTGGFANVTPGEVTVSFTADGARTCRPAGVGEWNGAQMNQLRAPIQGATVTFAGTIVCD